MWLDTAKSLEVGKSTYIPHYGCSERKVLWVYNNKEGWGCFCNKCGKSSFRFKGIQKISDILPQELPETRLYEVKLPEDVVFDVREFPNEARLWLYKADIRNDSIEKHKIGYSNYLKRVIIPVYNSQGRLITWQGRAIFDGQSPKYLNQESLDKNKHLFNPDKNEPCEKALPSLCIVTEDILSAIRVNQFYNVRSSIGTSLSDAQILELSKFDYVGIWYDPDRGGEDGCTKAVRRLNLYTNSFSIRSDKDPKNLSKREIKRIVNERFDYITNNEG